MIGDLAEEVPRDVEMIANGAVDDEVRRSQRTPALVQLASNRLDGAAAIGEATMALTPRCAERMTVSMFRSGDGSAAMTWMSTPSRFA